MIINIHTIEILPTWAMVLILIANIITIILMIICIRACLRTKRGREFCHYCCACCVAVTCGLAQMGANEAAK